MHVRFKHHLSDVVRLQALLLNGGIYLDADMVVLRPLDPILHHDITMGLIENGTGMGNAFIAAKRNSNFMREWYSHYNIYNNTEFYKNSLHVPRDMWLRDPSRLHMESHRLYRPNCGSGQQFYGNTAASQLYAVSSHQAVKRLEAGVVVTVYSLKRKPEKMHLVVQTDIHYLLCISALGKRPEIKGKGLWVEVVVFVPCL
nr:hypothetical protein BaRGS_031637 [Batillaria attramentaria]